MRRAGWFQSTLIDTVAYAYDGEGRRVLKQGPATTTEYVYDAMGELAAEYTVVGTAPAAPCTTCYLMTDHLGSTRMMTDAALTGGGGVQVRALHDYLPFGTEIRSTQDGRAAPWAATARI